MDKIKVGIVGATGFAGAELVRLLAGHKNAEITVLTSRQYAGINFNKIYPVMKGIINIRCEEYNQRTAEKADIFFLALPHKIPMEIAPELIAQGKKVIDLSADFRFADVNNYEKHYQKHKAKHLLKEAVYGLSEVYTNRIKKARLIGVPGCYPTSALLPLIPILKSKLIKPESIIIDSKSSVSGAGRSLSLTSMYCGVAESFKAYKVASHRHSPEIEEVLQKNTGCPASITFVPHLIPMSRGMETTIYAKLTDDRIEEKHILSNLSVYYKDRYFIRICKDRIPDTLAVRGTNFCDIGVKIDKRNNRLILLSVIDNLVKGAAGQAVQNMNIMFGLDERTGLDKAGYAV